MTILISPRLFFISIFCHLDNKENLDNVILKEPQLDEEVLELFDEDPSTSKALAIKLHSSIHNRWKF